MGLVRKSARKPVLFKRLRSRDVFFYDTINNPAPGKHFRFPQTRTVKENEPVDPEVTQALDYLNKNSVSNYQLLWQDGLTSSHHPKGLLYHVNFVAKKADVADAPEERFFAELILPPTASSADLPSARLCVSLGPINSITGNRLNGCFICRSYNNVWHPKGGGFTRGGGILYKTLKDIFDEEKHLPMLEEVSQAPEPSSLHVDNAYVYATEVLNFLYRRYNMIYKLVDPGFGTHVILPNCSLFHVNFTVEATDPSAPKKCYFAELTSTGGDFSVKHISELGPTVLRTGNVTGDKTNGCYYCHKFNKVRHPLSGGFVRGGDSLYKPVKEFLC